MKLEVRCPSCGKGYLVDQAGIQSEGSSVPCQACGASILLGHAATAAPAPASRPVESRAAPIGEVCCPRCGLHFAPAVRGRIAEGQRPTVLLVEDMEYFIEIARDALAGKYELKTAGTVDSARAVLLQGGVDLLLLDVTLERGEDGLALLRGAPGKTCPVLLFTAQDESEMYGERWAHLQALGIDDVVIKGMNMGEMLIRKVSALLGEPLPQVGPLR